MKMGLPAAHDESGLALKGGILPDNVHKLLLINLVGDKAGRVEALLPQVLDAWVNRRFTYRT